MKPYIKIINTFRTSLLQLYQIPILIYHSVGGDYIDAVPLDLFKRHLIFFKDNNYNVISLDKLTELLLKKDKIIMPTIALTFDDGYKDSFTYAYPVLRQYGFSATLFVIVNKISQQDYLDFNQMRQMVDDKLITIGSHSMNHPDLLKLDKKELLYEIETSKKVLEENLKCKIDLFAYPGGAFSPYIIEVVRQAGYKAAFTTNSKINIKLQMRYIYMLRRMTVDVDDSFLRFLVKVSGFGTCFARKIKYPKVNDEFRRIEVPCK